MKNIVLSNVINFLTNTDVSIVNNTENVVMSVLAGDITYQDGAVVALEHSPNDIWNYIIEDLKFDKVTVNLLENLKDSVEREDYISTSILKKEVLERWETLDEKYFWEMGRKYLFKLKQGIASSKLFKEYLPDVKKLENVWIESGFKEYKYVLESLLDLNKEVFSYNKETLYSDVNSYDGLDLYNHPYFSLELTLIYFKILHT